MNVLFHSTGWTQGKWVIVGMYITDVHFYAGWISSTHPPMYLLLSESVMSHFKKAQVLQYHTNKCEVDWGVRDFEAIVNQIMACCPAVFSKRWQNNEIKNLFVPVSFFFGGLSQCGCEGGRRVPSYLRLPCAGEGVDPLCVPRRHLWLPGPPPPTGGPAPTLCLHSHWSDEALVVRLNIKVKYA